MGLLIVGINHKTATVDLRGEIAFAPEQMNDALVQLRRNAKLKEATILSTCNRTELYCETSNEVEGGHGAAILSWLEQYHDLPESALDKCHYIYQSQVAVQHLMRVASGLDSMVLGEPQILGQIKSAYAVAQQSQTVGPELSRLFQKAFATAKQIRTDTAIGENPVSVAYAAVSLAKHIFSDLSTCNALLIGAGEMMDLVARHLQNNGIKKIVVANRTLERAQQLAQQFDAEAIMLADIPDQLVQADIVISSTASQLPILGKGAVERALKARKHAPIFMVDIAVPRDIEPQVGELEDVYLYSVDDLKDVITENLKSREGAAKEAEVIIKNNVSEYMVALRSLGAVDTIRDYRKKAESIRQIELDKALKQLEKTGDAAKVLNELSRNITNKLTHAPSVELKQASADGRVHVLDWAKQLFGLNAEDSPEENNNKT